MTKPDGMHGSLQRSLESLTLGVARNLHAKRTEGADLKLQQGMQHFQIPVSGWATSDGSVTRSAELRFDFAFYPAKAQTFGGFDRPNFTWGFMLDRVDARNPVTPIFLCVMCEFDDAEPDVTETATIHVSALAHVHDPGNPNVEFSGRLHVTFQGFGALVEDQSDAGE